MVNVYELQDENEVAFVQGNYFFKPKFDYCSVSNSLIPNTDSKKLRIGEKLNKHGGTIYKIKICALGSVLFDKFNNKDDMRLHIE